MASAALGQHDHAQQAPPPTPITLGLWDLLSQQVTPDSGFSACEGWTQPLFTECGASLNLANEATRPLLGSEYCSPTSPGSSYHCFPMVQLSEAQCSTNPQSQDTVSQGRPPLCALNTFP